MIIEKAKEKFKDIECPHLFLFDEDKEYYKEIMAYDQSDFKVLLVEDNYFKVKCTLEIEDKESRYLLYHAFARPTKKDYSKYPLIDLLFANQELVVDDIADILDTYGLHYSLIPLFKKYQRFVKSKKYSRQMAPVFSAKPFSENRLLNTIISILIGERKSGQELFNLIRIFEILNEREEQWEKCHKDLVRYELEKPLINSIANITNHNVDDISYTSLKNLFLSLKYNAICKNIPSLDKKDNYKKFKIKDALSITKIDAFFKEWEDSKSSSDSLENVVQNLGREIDEEKIIAIYGMDVEYGLHSNRFVDYSIKEAILRIKETPSWVIDEFGAWSNNAENYIGLENELDFLVNAAKFYQLLQNYKDFIFDFIEDYISKYEKELYKIDLYYRHAFTYYQKLVSNHKEKRFTSVFEDLNKLYDEYLIDLNSEWLKILEEKDFNLQETKIAKQYNFYQDFVEKEKNKKVVIISDAFRYELAIDLQNELIDSNNQVEVSPILASIPSYTNLGMSNLLPNKGIEVVKTENSIDYLIDGIRTSSQNRAKILQAYEPQADTIDYASFSKMSRDEQRELIKENQILYIYHNWIDAIGDDRQTEYKTFESVAEAVNELKTLVERLYNSLNTYNIFITADHGFLFNYKTIQEKDRQESPKLNSILKEHTRFYITDDKSTDKETYLLGLSNTTNIKSDENVVLPKTINRFRKRGGFGVQFVHGGASLQEIIVPVLEFYRDRRNQAQDVSFTRIDKTEVMTTSSAKFKILQEHPVGLDYKPREINIALYDTDGNLISTEYELELKATGEQATERVYEFSLELNAQGSKESIGYLKAFDIKDSLNPIFNDMIKINLMTQIDTF